MTEKTADATESDNREDERVDDTDADSSEDQNADDISDSETQLFYRIICTKKSEVA